MSKKNKEEKISKKEKYELERIKQIQNMDISDKEKSNRIKFGNPRKLGFMRILMIYYVFTVAVLMLSALVLTKNNLPITPSTINGIIDLVIYSICFYMLWKRKEAARIVCIISTAIDLLISIIDIVINQVTASAILNASFGIIVNIAIILYFIFSRRVKYTLSNPINIDFETNKKISETKNYFRPSKWAFWRNLIIMFFVFSVVGHWLEFGYCTLIKYHIIPGTIDPNSQIWSDFLFPFPIYGAGAVACALIFYPLKNKLRKAIKNPVVTIILIFVISGVVCTLMELAMGLATNQDFKLWDYRTMAFNFMGQVCLQNSIAFAVAATSMTYIVYPALESLFARIPKEFMTIIFVCVFVFGSALFIFYYFKFLPEQVEQLTS